MGNLKDNEKARREELGPALPAIQRYKIGYHSDEWGVRSLSPVGIYDDAGPWVRYEDHAAALAAGKTAVQYDLLTIRKPTTRAEMLWLLKLAHLVISDVDKTLEETFAPAQELRESFTAADMATAASQGFRDGVASLSAHTARLEPARADTTQEDAERHFFDAGWKACANFCDRDDVRFDGIVGHRGCPQFEEAFRAARKQGATP